MSSDAVGRTGRRPGDRLRRAIASLWGDQPERFGRTFGTFMVSIWLVFLLEPIAAAWQLPNHFRGFVGILTTLVFAVSYLRVFFAGGFVAYAGGGCAPRPRGQVLSGYAVCAALAAACTLIIGQAGTVAWVFFSVAGLWVWSFWRAIGVSLALSILYLVLQYRAPGWTVDYSLLFAMLLAMMAASGGMLASRRGHDLHTAREENAALLVEEERNRMARDLHDILGHSLTVITVKAELAGRLLDAGDDRARKEVADLERLSRGALADVRRAVEGFREISLAGELVRAREALTSAGVEAHLPGAVDEVPEGLQEVFAWTVREAVTNVVRHAHATSCEVTVDRVGISVTDDGVGRAVAGVGNGLRGLQERAGAAGTQLITSSLQPHGFQVRMVVPVAEADAAAPGRAVALRRPGGRHASV